MVRNANNSLVANAPVGMRVSILQGDANGTVVYMETQTAVTNATGFGALPAGYYDGSLCSFGNRAGFWSSTEASDGTVWYRYLRSSNANVDRLSGGKFYGSSVRCLRD